MGIAPGGGGAEALEGTACSEDPMGHPGKDSSPSWRAFGRGGTASLETKELGGANVLPCSLA